MDFDQIDHQEPGVFQMSVASYYHLLHAGECLPELVELLALGPGEVLELREEERVLEDALDRLDQVRLQRRRLLLPRVQRVQEVLQGRVAVVCNDK